MSSKPCFPAKGLYAITSDNLSEKENNIEPIEAVLKGGASVIQFRQKDSKKRDLVLKNALAIKSICEKYSATFIVNDDIELTLKANADGVHLGQEDVSYELARKVLGEEKIIGISCYNSLERAINAEEKGADYVAFGSFFKSTTKKNASLCSLKILREASDEIDLPIVAIGGITVENGLLLLENGADLLACVASVFENGDPYKSAKTINGLFRRKQTNE